MTATTRDSDFFVEHLSGEQQRIAAIVLHYVEPGDTGGGCRAFYTPKQWKERGESYGLNSRLIVCHDGGALAPLFNPRDRGDVQASNAMHDSLRAMGYYVESCTCWYSAIHPTPETVQRENRLLRLALSPPG